MWDWILLELPENRTTEHSYLKSLKISEAARSAPASLKDEPQSTTKAMELEPSRSRHCRPHPWISQSDEGICTHKSNFATVKPWFCREPLPHESAGRTVVHRVNKTSDVIIDWILAYQIDIRMCIHRDNALWKVRSSVFQPCCRAMTKAIVWLPLHKLSNPPLEWLMGQFLTSLSEIFPSWFLWDPRSLYTWNPFRLLRPWRFHKRLCLKRRRLRYLTNSMEWKHSFQLIYKPWNH